MGGALALGVLFAINTLNFFDRQILGAIGEPIRKEWGLGDGALGALGTAFTLLYAFVGVPLGRLADRTSRTRLLAVGVVVWSALTAVSGAARSFWQLFVFRLGVGVGEAVCAPAATSLIGDLVPATRRARALAVFMLGLPVGVALSFAVSGMIAHTYGWRTAFYVAGLPGLLCAIAVLFVREPERGATEVHAIGSRRREGSPYAVLLAIPTMLWLVVSGALHNFNMYAIGAFLTPFLMRYHGAGIQTANFAATAIYGLAGAPGLLLGGIAGDAVARRFRAGRLLVGTIAIAVSVPLFYVALGRAQGDLVGFGVLMGLSCALMYGYYSTVYATIHDVVEPGLRGTAMALYFFAMYVLGASLGPYATGLLSDHFTRRAAEAAGVVATTQQALEPFRVEGLHSAMYAIPILGALLVVVLYAASRTAPRDVERLEEWMQRDARASRQDD